MKPQTPELVPGQTTRGRRTSLQRNNIAHADPAMGAHRDARELTSPAQVDDVLARRAQHDGHFAGAQQFIASFGQR
jgi:hypothetical protein